MIQEIPPERHLDLISLFAGNRYLDLISRSLLKQGIGILHVDDIDEPSVAMLTYKFIIFLAGDPHHDAVSEILDKVPQRFLLFIPDTTWVKKFEERWGSKLKSRERTKFSSTGLTIEHMERILQEMPKGMQLEPLTQYTVKEISDQAKGIINLLFPDLDSFMKTNFGFCLLERERIVSLALAATPFENGNFEIHIETDPEYQKRGLAMITAAQLIKHSLVTGLTPHWDADNQPSAKLATRLGFSDPEEYQTYFWIE